MNNRQVAQEWAKQSGQAYRRGNNFYFEGATIFSYGPHFPIATFEEFEGKRCVMFTEASWGNATHKHIGHVRAALRNVNVPVFYTPNLATYLRYGRTEMRPLIYQCYLGKAQNFKNKASAARTKRAFYKGQAAEMLKAAEAYAVFFSLPVEPSFPSILYYKITWLKELV